MRLLALDIGKRHTGVAFGETQTDFIVALDTIHHKTTEDLVSALKKIVTEKKIEKLVIGMPLLPGGEAGEQAHFAQESGERISRDLNIPVVYLDERYTTDEKGESDPNAKAACNLLSVALGQLKNGIDIF